MSSVQRLIGRPRVLLPLIRPFRMKLVTLRVRAMCPNYFNFRLCTSVRNLLFGCSSSKIEAFVPCSLQLILNILLHAVVSNAIILLLSAASSVHVSQAYNPTGQTMVHIIVSFICLLSARSFQIHSSDLITVLTIANLVIYVPVVYFSTFHGE